MLAKANDNAFTDNQEGQGHPVIRTLYDHLEEVTCLEFHPNKPILASGSRDCNFKLFDYSKSSVKKAFKTISVRLITTLYFSQIISTVYNNFTGCRTYNMYKFPPTRRLYGDGHQ